MKPQKALTFFLIDLLTDYDFFSESQLIKTLLTAGYKTKTLLSFNFKIDDIKYARKTINFIESTTE
jgi:hypothetical protein